jgi:hypothetical protein
MYRALCTVFFNVLLLHKAAAELKALGRLETKACSSDEQSVFARNFCKCIPSEQPVTVLLVALTVQNTVSLSVAGCCLVEIYQHSERTCYLSSKYPDVLS